MEIKTVYWKNQHCTFVCAYLRDGNTVFLCIGENGIPVHIDPKEVEGINL